MMSNQAKTDPTPTWLSRSALAAPLPTATDVVIVGGGIIGCSLAYYLARAGVEVLLLERSALNREASGTNAGSFHLQVAIHQLQSLDVSSQASRLVPEIAMYVAAADLWQTLEKELAADLNFHTTGGLMVAETAREFDVLVAKQQIEHAAGLETHNLTGSELRDFAPFLADDLAGASYCPREGHVNPLHTAPTFALRAAERGAAIRVGAEVLSATPLKHGEFAVNTSRGTVRAKRVVNATGARAAEFALRSGLDLRSFRSEGLHVNVTEPWDPVLTPMIQHIGRRLTLKQSAENTFIIGGGWPADARPFPQRFRTEWRSAAGNIAVALRVMPMLHEVRLVRTWAGAGMFIEDMSPLVGEAAQLPGYFTCVATTGFTLGPLLAKWLAESMVSDDRSTQLPESFAPSRSLRLVQPQIPQKETHGQA
jgi:glycine/D-amino acid oxidase-like deaminating enzyme